MKVYQILSLSLFFSFLSQGCHYSHNASTKGEIKQSLVTSNEEKFDEFKKLFYSDSVFQMSRIIFPLASDVIDSSSNVVENSITTVLNKQNWVMVRDDYFKDDSIANIDGQIYKRKTERINSKIVESFYIENSGYRITLIFSLKNGKWYLIDHIVLDN
jgi:hypothetical protein